MLRGYIPPGEYAPIEPPEEPEEELEFDPYDDDDMAYDAMRDLELENR